MTGHWGAELGFVRLAVIVSWRDFGAVRSALLLAVLWARSAPAEAGGRKGGEGWEFPGVLSDARGQDNQIFESRLF